MPSVSIPTAITAAASIGSAVIGSQAAGSAAHTQASAANNSAQMQMNMFNQIQGNLQPYMAAGQAGIPMLQGLLGTGPGPGQGSANGSPAPPGQPLGGGNPLTGSAAASALGPTSGLFTGGGNSAMQDIQQALIRGNPISDASWAKAGLPPGGGSALNPTGANGTSALPGGNAVGATPFDPMATLKQTPGYQFALDQGLQATQNSYASKGLAKSGAALKGAANYSEGLASTTYQSQLDNYFRLTGMGQNAAVGAGGFGTTAAAGAGSTLTSGAAATAGGTVGAANAITGAIGNIGGQAVTQYNNNAPPGGTGLFGPRTPNPLGVTYNDAGQPIQ